MTARIVNVSFHASVWVLVLTALVTTATPAPAVDATPVRFRIAGIDTGGANPRELPNDLDPKKRKAIEKAMRDSQKFAGKKQRITCQQCLLLAMLAIGREIGENNMKSQSGVAKTAGLVATAPYPVPLDKNLAEIARAVQDAEYNHKITPKVQFGLMVVLDKKAAGRTLSAVKKIDGAAAAGAAYDAKEKTLWFSVDPEKDLELAAVVEALKGAGADVAIKPIADKPAKAE
jgi:hypothetical protein